MIHLLKTRGWAINNRKLTIENLIASLTSHGLFLGAIQSQNVAISRIAPIEEGKAGDLVFADKKEYVELVKNQKPSVVVAPESLRAAFSEIPGLVVLVAKNVGLAHALIKQEFADRNFHDSGWEGIHPSAVIHESAQLSVGVVVEPRVVIAKNVKIGKNSRIMAGAVIENDVTIGEDCLIHPQVLLGYGTQIGNQVEIGPGTVIGSQGFSFAQDHKKKSYAIPQTGIVVIEDRVRLGANNCIDRAAYRITRIGAGTKMDNLCHVAHNVDIGEDCLLTAMLCVAGSTKIGNRVIASGQTGILDHIQICDDVVLLQKAGVSKDVTSPGAYAGSPIQPLGDYMKNTAVTRAATELRKRVGELEKKIENLPLDKRPN